MNKSLVKALYELHERGITENEWEHLQWGRDGHWFYCDESCVGITFDCEYRVKPRIVSVGLEYDDLDRLLYELPLELHGKAGRALKILQQAIGEDKR